MTILLLVILYSFLGAMSGARHHAIESERCGAAPQACFKPLWCGHCFVSVWVAGVFWPLGLPALVGAAIGGSTKERRIERRRAAELAEAEHVAELAKQKRIADYELDRQLAALENKTAS